MRGCDTAILIPPRFKSRAFEYVGDFLMATRIFKCEDCSHSLRLGAKNCGVCYFPTPLYNRRTSVFLGLCAVLILIGLIAVIATNAR